MPATTIAVYAKKGGVGKTTTTLNLGASLANQARVLLVDTDAQANLTQGILGPQATERLPAGSTITTLFDDRCDPNPDHTLHPTDFPGITLLPANDTLSPHLHPRPRECGSLQFALRDFLELVADRFDFILIDSPPAIANLLGWNALTAAHHVITPIQVESFSAQSIVGVEEKIGEALAGGNPGLKFLGYFVNLRDKRKTVHQINEDALRAKYGQQVFQTVIYDRAAFTESQNLNQHVYVYAPKSDCVRMFDAFAVELLDRIAHAHTKTADPSPPPKPKPKKKTSSSPTPKKKPTRAKRTKGRRAA